MNMKKKRKFSALSAALLLTVGLLSTVSCTGDDLVANGHEQTERKREKNTVTFISEAMPETRTIISHSVQGGPAKVRWTVGDKIWVKDDHGVFQSSTVTASGLVDNGRSAMFTLTGDFTQATHEVVFNNGAKVDEVKIDKSQTQINLTESPYIGWVGDCATGTAKKVGTGGFYVFKLTHKAAYLCFSPRVEANKNTSLGQNIGIYRIEVEANGALAGTYDFSDGTLVGKSPKANPSNKITLWPQKSNDYTNVDNLHIYSLPGTTKQTAFENHRFYMAIPPGTRQLKVTYELMDKSPELVGSIPFDPNAGQTLAYIMGTVEQQLPMHTYAENTVTDITFDIDAALPVWSAELAAAGTTPAQEYYLFKAQDKIPESTYEAKLHGWITWPTAGQPYAEGGAPGATTYATDGCPNLNEVLWYIQRGDPIYERTLTQDNNHLRWFEGVWLKKKSKIPGFSDTHAPDGMDYRTFRPTNYQYPAKRIGENGVTRPSSADYFFLPNYGRFRRPGAGYVYGVPANMGWFENYVPVNTPYRINCTTTSSLSYFYYEPVSNSMEVENMYVDGGAMPIWTGQ